MSTLLRQAVDRTAEELTRRSTHPHALLVVQHGRIIAERRWAPWDTDEPMLVYSVSKTFTSAAVGLAVADGAFGYQDTLAELWPEAAEGAGPRARSIRVREALAMAGGHSAEQATALAEELAWTRHPDGLATARAFLAAEPEHRPGSFFAYNNLGTWMLAEVVRRTTGTDVWTLLTSRVLEPLGIGGPPWDRDAQGHPLGFSGLHLRPSELARFATLLLDDGVWQGERLLPSQWIREHRRIQVSTAGEGFPDWERGYGWQVWMSRHGYRLDGAFGQFALILPQARAVVVSTNETADCAQPVLDTIWAHLVPVLEAGAAAVPEVSEPDLRTLQVPVVAGRLDRSRIRTGTLQEGDRLTLTPTGDRWQLEWRRPSGEQHTIAVGHGRWLHSHLVTAEGEIELAASAGERDGVLEIRIAVTTTPHTLVLNWSADRLSQHWFIEPLTPGGLFSQFRLSAGR